MAARGGHVILLQKLWYLVKELQLNPQDLRNEMLSKDESGNSVWPCGRRGHVSHLLTSQELKILFSLSLHRDFQHLYNEFISCVFVNAVHIIIFFLKHTP